MRPGIALIFVVASMAIASCKKHTTQPPVTPPPITYKKILLKDIEIPNLPSPYYHFEYGADSQVVKASFNNYMTMYDVIYNGKDISEMRINNLVNQDTLRYIYDNTGKVGLIIYINRTGVTYKHVFITYNGQQIIKMEWDRMVGNVGFIIYRTLTFNYFSDGNVKEIIEHWPAIDTQPEITYSTQYDQYDDKINVDNFTLWHEGITDYLFLLPNIRIQINNPRKVIHTGDGDNYTADYSYTYNKDSMPITRTGEVIFTKGPDAGKTSEISTSYTYY